MLSVVKREDLTREILIENNEISELRTIKLPVGWWLTTLSYDLEKSKKTLTLLKCTPPIKNRKTAPSFPKIDNWDLRKGDYMVKNTYKKSLSRNPEYKKIIAFTHFSFTIVITITAVVLILSQIAKI
ncbi:MAG: hypothetical protein COZ80_05340 [Ignavibacteria bacterium CG_4_8_14_3_um_filter_37_9]|nr:hypothetical protein [Ignavibacteria bacterium]OIO18194.1 MAG: hypothetical protein AUJ54_08785 [Ignavibacteria bacterium CG1_02_37_35]PIW99447.1 MAG: hypothetical protein COZ80_05340 [Ignavibacteria bacterium CG_4_8_14_3_um_filter_37_9]PIX93631.1 MAG: hypothetical protein COZ25_09730 [Ignavibacteria bacterium CG_4_10_14_3_um_filter_37_18]PJC59666.1 MAG: hypothetical protein CO025_05465 [Ignavibacteria bacterium CG_4_9_14_0_2_um_filter_37_13]